MIRWISSAAFLLVLPAFVAAQQEYDVTIPTSLGDTTETFWLQIPAGYKPTEPRPLLIGWHEWGGDRHEMRDASDLDSLASARGWIAASHDGRSPTNWANRATQSHVVDVIHWIEARYAVDATRIYMVGASMGGAAGMVFADNHLDPAGPMIAAAASISGVQDCERRYREQGINESMIAAFGGTPDSVPHEYHRNSAIYFADSTESMHVNARHLPLFLTFGSGDTDNPWRRHAEDLYAAMAPVADTVVLRESTRAGHGWVCAEGARICDFLGAFSLPPLPARISINADADGPWYWADIRMRDPAAGFARLDGAVDAARAHLDLAMIRNVQSATLALSPLGFPLDAGRFDCLWRIEDGGEAGCAFAGVGAAPAAVTRDGLPYDRWTYDPLQRLLRLYGEGTAVYAVIFAPASASDPPSGVGPTLEAWIDPAGGIRYRAAVEGALVWRLVDVQGRRVAGGEIPRRAAGAGRIAPLPRPPNGTYFLDLRIPGCPRCRVARTVTLLR